MLGYRHKPMAPFLTAAPMHLVLAWNTNHRLLPWHSNMFQSHLNRYRFIAPFSFQTRRLTGWTTSLTALSVSMAPLEWLTVSPWINHRLFWSPLPMTNVHSLTLGYGPFLLLGDFLSLRHILSPDCIQLSLRSFKYLPESSLFTSVVLHGLYLRHSLLGLNTDSPSIMADICWSRYLLPAVPTKLIGPVLLTSRKHVNMHASHWQVLMITDRY